MDILKKYINNEYTFDQLESEWSVCYANLDDSKQSIELQELLAEINEKIEYTVNEPDGDRAYGYITPKELYDWLKIKIESIKF